MKTESSRVVIHESARYVVRHVGQPPCKGTDALKEPAIRADRKTEEITL
jgi:hypothetical protein